MGAYKIFGDLFQNREKKPPIIIITAYKTSFTAPKTVPYCE